MDLTNRLFLGVVYVIVGIAIGATAIAAFRFYGTGEMRHELAATREHESKRDVSRGQEELGYSRGVHIQQIYTQRAQIVRLQSLLEQKTALLNRKTSLLDEKIAEQQALQAELDSAIHLLETLAAGFKEPDAGLQRTEEDGKLLDAEVERLRSDSEKNRDAARDQQVELDLLMMELAVTDEKITRLEEESRAELAALMEQRIAFETTVSGVVAQMGEPAIPILIGCLDHERADIRRWAIDTLGAMGPLAKDAVPPLLEALRDRNQTVGAAAKIALEKIDRMGR